LQEFNKSDFTVFQADLYAILEVATSKEVTEGLEGVIQIYSDSQAALKTLLNARMNVHK